MQSDLLQYVVNETKLSNDAPFTTRQNTFFSELTNGNTNFELRSAKFGATFPQGAPLEVKAYVNTIGSGTPGGTYTVIRKY